MQVCLPEFSENDNEVMLTLWHVKESGRVTSGDDLLEVVTDKATFDIPAPCSGVLTKIIKDEGEKAATGDLIAEIQEDN